VAPAHRTGYDPFIVRVQTQSPSQFSPRVVLALIAALTALRVAALALTPLNLHGDEAQYWNWSRTLDWGYYSKPPLIAWTIAATTSVFGNAEWAVRLAAPLAQGVAAAVLCVLGRRIYGDLAGAWAGLGWALMPGVQLSSIVISTDALVLPLWSIALLCLWRLVETRERAWAVGLGAAIGLGALAKYSMFYFLIGAALSCLMSARTRAALLGPSGAVAAAVIAILIAPNMAWNAAHGFATIAHTASNAAIGKHPFHPEGLFFFVVEQLGVAGPLHVAALTYLFADAWRRRAALTEADRFLFSFAAPAVAIISVQAILSRANANWAVAAYPAAIVWIAGRFAAPRSDRLLKASAALNAGLAVILFVGLLAPGLADAAGFGNALKRVRAWPETARVVAARARAQGPFTAIMVDNRLLYYDLAYYLRDQESGAPLRMWQLDAAPGNSAEMSAPDSWSRR